MAAASLLQKVASILGSRKYYTPCQILFLYLLCVNNILSALDEAKGCFFNETKLMPAHGNFVTNCVEAQILFLRRA